MTKDQIKQLMDTLKGLSSYNDKGYIWMSHSPEQVEAARQRYRESIDEQIASIGEAEVPKAVLDELRSEKLIEDGSGLIHERIEAQLVPKARS